MEVYNLIIEITRRCNLTCEHCLRGDIQNKDIKKETIYKFLKDNEISFISQVTFTGGEPTLNPQAIQDFIDICKELNIVVQNFYMALNGTQCPDSFLKVLFELYSFCNPDLEEGLTQIEISRTDWHYGQDEEAIKKLKAFSFVREKEQLNYLYVIAEGRGNELAELNGTIDQARRIKVSPLEINDDRIEETLYLNVKGDILTECDLSYKRQDKEKVGNVYTKTLKEMEVENNDTYKI